MEKDLMMLRNSIVFVLLCLPALLWASGDPVVFEAKHSEAVVRLVKGKPQTTHLVDETYHYLTEMASNYGQHAVYYSFFAKLEEIEAFSLIPTDGGKFRKAKVRGFNDHADVDEGIFYDDSRARSFTFPELTKNARGQVRYQLKLEDPMVQPAFFFGSGIRVEASSFTLKVEKGIDITFKLFNCEGLDIVFTQEQKGSYTVYTWQTKGVPAMPQESNGQAWRYYLPHLMYRINAYKSGKDEVVLFKDLESLYAHNYKFVAHVYEQEHSELQPLVDSLTAGLTDPIAKTAAIYRWVQASLKYVAFEENYRGLKPFEPQQVIASRFGDCKDMTSVLFSLMRLANLPVYMAWIGTRELPYRYTEWPTTQVDNHMIAVYHSNDTTIYLDGTGSYTPFGFPTEMIQGKEVLLAINKEKFKVLEVPTMPANASQSIDSIQMRWNGKYLEGSSRSQLRGYLKSNYSYRFQDLSAEELRKSMSETLSWGNNAFTVNKPSYRNDLRGDKPLELDFDFVLKDYGLQLQDELIINLHLDKSILKMRVELDNRRSAVQLDHNFSALQVLQFEIPAAYQISKLPEAKAISNPYFSYSVKYEQQDGRIYMHSSIATHQTVVPVSDLPSYNAFLDELRGLYKQAITLKKIKP